MFKTCVANSHSAVAVTRFVAVVKTVLVDTDHDGSWPLQKAEAAAASVVAVTRTQLWEEFERFMENNFRLLLLHKWGSVNCWMTWKWEAGPVSTWFWIQEPKISLLLFSALCAVLCHPRRTQKRAATPLCARESSEALVEAKMLPSEAFWVFHKETHGQPRT